MFVEALSSQGGLLGGVRGRGRKRWQTYRVALWTVISRGSFGTGGSSSSRWASLAFLSSFTFGSLGEERRVNHHVSSSALLLLLLLKGVRRLTQGQRLLLGDSGQESLTVKRSSASSPTATSDLNVTSCQHYWNNEMVSSQTLERENPDFHSSDQTRDRNLESLRDGPEDGAQGRPRTQPGDPVDLFGA